LTIRAREISSWKLSELGTPLHLSRATSSSFSGKLGEDGGGAEDEDEEDDDDANGDGEYAAIVSVKIS
jgi:hypothetical protein